MVVRIIDHAIAFSPSPLDVFSVPSAAFRSYFVASYRYNKNTLLAGCGRCCLTGEYRTRDTRRYYLSEEKIVGVIALSLFYRGRRALSAGAAYAWEYAVIDGVSGKARTCFREW